MEEEYFEVYEGPFTVIGATPLPGHSLILDKEYSIQEREALNRTVHFVIDYGDGFDEIGIICGLDLYESCLIPKVSLPEVIKHYSDYFTSTIGEIVKNKENYWEEEYEKIISFNEFIEILKGGSRTLEGIYDFVKCVMKNDKLKKDFLVFLKNLENIEIIFEDFKTLPNIVLKFDVPLSLSDMKSIINIVELLSLPLTMPVDYDISIKPGFLKMRERTINYITVTLVPNLW